MSGTGPGPRRSRRRLWILVAVLVTLPLLAGGAWVLRQYQRERLAQQALVDGKAAFEKGDWETARQQLGKYIGRFQEDFDALGLYAQAQLNCRPLPIENILQAASAYRRMLRIQPTDADTFERLALIYQSTGNVTELGQIARARLAAAGENDGRALLAIGREEAALRQPDKASNTLRKLIDQPVSEAAPEPVLVEAFAALVELENSADTETARKATDDVLAAALQRFPAARLLLAQRAGHSISRAVRATGSGAEPLRAAAQADLAAACDPLPDDPRVLLALAEGAMILREFDRAKTILEHARSLDPALIARKFIDPAAFDAEWFKRAGALAAVSGQPDRAVALTREYLKKLEDKRTRLEILPLSIELLARGGIQDESDADRTKRIAEARVVLDEFLKLIAPLPQGTFSDQQVVMLKSVVAMAEGTPYEVINLLEPFRSGSTFPPLAALLLNEAYVETNQSIRIAAAGSAAGEGGSVIAVSQARRVVQALAERGAWDAVLSTIATLPPDAARSDPDLRVAGLGARLELALAARKPRAELDALTAETRALRDEFPKRSDVAILLASVEQNAGREPAARAELERASRECEPADLPLIALARLEAASDNRDRALELLREATQREPARISAWLALAGLQYEMEKSDDALATLDAALASEAGKEPDRQRRLRQRRAVLLVARGDRAGGEAALKALAAESAKDVEVRSLLLDLPDALKDVAAAQKLVDEIKAVEGAAGIRWRFHQARLWLASPEWQGKAKETRDLLAYCIDADRRWTAPVLLLGALQQRTADMTGAEATYRAGLAATQDPAIADQLLALLQTQRRFSDAKDIIARMEQRLSEQAVSARRVSVAVGEGRYGDAIAELEARGAAGTSEPGDLIRRAQLGYALRRDAKTALARLDEAEKAGAEPLVVARVRASILQNEKRSDEARTVLNDAVAKIGSVDAYLLRGSFLASIGDQAAADADFAKILGLSNDEMGFALQGEHFAQTERLNEAIGVWEAGLERFPKSVMLKRGLVKAKILRNQPEDRPAVEKLLAELGGDMPGDPEVIWVRAANLFRTNPRDLAPIRALLAEAERAPKAPVDVYRGLTDLARQTGDAKLMLNLALRGLTFYPADPVLLVNRAEAMLFGGDPRGAREAVRSALNVDRNNLRAIELLAIVARELKDDAGYRDPLDQLTSICSAQPENEPAHLLLAQVMRLAGDAPGSLALLRKFRASVPAAAKSVVVLLESAESARAAKDPGAAEAFLKEADAVAADDARTLRGWAAYYADSKKFDELAAFAEARLDKAETAGLLLAAAAALGEQPPKLDIAVRLAEKVVGYEPKNAAAHFLIGNIAYGRGQIEPAEKAFRAAVDADPTAAAPLNNLAWLLASDLAKYDEALALANRAVAVAPGEYNYRDTLAFILDRKGDSEGARREYLACLSAPTLPAEGRAQYLLKVVMPASRLKDNGPLRPLLKELQQLQTAPPRPLTAEERAALDAVIQSMGTSQ